MVGLLLLMVIAPIVLAIIAIVRMNSLSAEVRRLEGEFLNLKEALKKNSGALPAAQSTAAAPPSPPSQAPPRPVQQSPQFSPPTPSPAAVQPPIAAARPVPKPAPPPEPSRTREEWESFVGGKLLNRIGAIAIIMGVGFFLKYAIDNNWITETMRVIIGLLTGTGIILGAVRSHRRGFEIFAQGLFGAGISILYLSFYAAFNFYHLLSQPVAFGAMACVTVAAFSIALLYDSPAIALIAWAGGYLTPFLLSTGHANEIGLFSYIALLQTGLLTIVVRKPKWIILELLTLLGTYLVFTLWFQEYSGEAPVGMTVLFLSVFWGLFFSADLHMTARGEAFNPELRLLAGLLNAAVYYLFMYLLIDPKFHEWMGGTTLAICLAYASRIAIPAVRRGHSEKMLAQNLFTALLLLVLATAIQFKGFTTAMFWSLEALALIWCGLRWNYKAIRYAALTLFLLALWKLADTQGAFATTQLNEFRVLLNYRALTFAVIAGAMGAAAYLFPGEGIDFRFKSALHAAWSALVFGWITIELNDFFNQIAASMTSSSQEILQYEKMMTLLCGWTLYSLPLVILGLKEKSVPVATSGLLTAAVTLMTSFVLGISFTPIEAYHPLANVRMLALLVVLAGSYLHLIRINQHRAEYDWIKDVSATLKISLVLMFLWLLTGETRDFYERQILFLHTDGEITSAENLKQLSLSGLWLFYGAVLMVIGISMRNRGIRILSIVLLGVSILKIFIYDLSFLETLYRIFSFIGLGVILLAASYLYQKYKAVILEVPAEGGAAGV